MEITWHNKNNFRKFSHDFNNYSDQNYDCEQFHEDSEVIWKDELDQKKSLG